MKLLFFDIDGTLITDDRQVPDSVKPALIRARENGCQLFLNTGRTCCNMDCRLEDLPWDGIITGCGTRVAYRGRTLKAVEFSHAETLEILRIIRGSGIPAIYECDTAMYFDPAYASVPVVTLFRQFSDNAGISRNIGEDDPAFRAVKMFVFSEAEAPVRELLGALKRAGYPYDAIDRGNAGWEMIPADCSKAAGIDLIREAAGASLADCYAFGDSTNDLAMLTHVPNSVAMGNAPDEVKKKCAFITDRPENDGIGKALISLGLI